ncbi:hypothetical protein AG1IA_07589 [Rhizoctonia solani AG-1 IA]|uniref:Uncharacterized protein n=1 Tax=Thanatephorus cucumeris (strain AG1-IA) TaxID=983506 RepID=L8WNP0_THACA|nr:hypothetical protein AG1IA_07589 [Rhizoctonia solani AG-1 IA]
MAVGNAVTNATGPDIPTKKPLPEARRPIISGSDPAPNTVRYMIRTRPSRERPNATT